MKQLFTASPGAKYEIIQEMISRDDNLLNITWLCEIAGIHRSGFYHWQKSQKARVRREQKDQEDFALILAAYKHRGYDKGARGIHMRLLHQGPPVVMNVKKVRRLMSKFNLHCPIRKPNPYRLMSSRIATSHVAPNILNRQFKAHGARKVLLTDITYIPRRKAHESDSLRFSYLSVIMDAYTKQVLAWVLSLSLEVDFVLETVQQLMDKHGDELKTDVMMHSDQGGHYKSTKFIEIMQSKRLRQSMSRKANCWDNAPQESLFGHMKSEIHLNPSDNHTEIEAKIADWMDYYNNERYQWSLMKLSPNEFYRYTKTGEYPLPGEPPAQLEGGEETDDLD